MATRTIDEALVTGVRRKSFSETYIGDWITTTDHKKIGMMYLITAFFFFLAGGMEAMLDPHTASRTEREGAEPGRIQPGLHDARHHHDLPVRHAGDDRLR